MASPRGCMSLHSIRKKKLRWQFGTSVWLKKLDFCLYDIFGTAIAIKSHPTDRLGIHFVACHRLWPTCGAHPSYFWHILPFHFELRRHHAAMVATLATPWMWNATFFRTSYAEKTRSQSWLVSWRLLNRSHTVQCLETRTRQTFSARSPAASFGNQIRFRWYKKRLGLLEKKFFWQS